VRSSNSLYEFWNDEIYLINQLNFVEEKEIPDDNKLTIDGPTFEVVVDTIGSSVGSGVGSVVGSLVSSGVGSNVGSKVTMEDIIDIQGKEKDLILPSLVDREVAVEDIFTANIEFEKLVHF